MLATTITRCPVEVHRDDDTPSPPEVSPMDSGQTKRAAREDRPRSSDQFSQRSQP